MHFIFWQNILSPHQAAFLRCLADSGHEVTVVATESMTRDRLALGWKVPDMGRARVVIGPDAVETRRLVESSPKEAIHVIAGARWTRLGNRATQHCLASGRRLGIMSEGPDPRGVLGYGRRVKYMMERYARGFHYDFVLAMGEMGVDWFRCCGYPASIVFPFAYVTDPARLAHTNGPANAVSLLYAGRFIARKGLDLLLSAFAAVPPNGAKLYLLGEGRKKQHLQGYARSLGIQSRIVWLANRKSDEVKMEMEKADVTLLPSQHDGWGAVVNESLMVGTPVICSAACGATELLQEPWLGTVFRSGDVEDLAKSLKHWIGLGSRPPVERERIRRWASCITGEAVAKYLVAIADHVYSNSVRPVAPWRIPQLEVPSAEFQSGLRTGAPHRANSSVSARHFVFWQNILSPHQTPYLRSLADLGHEVTVVAEEAMTPDRMAMGWNVPDLGRARVVVGPGAVEIRRLIESSPKESIHVMAGARWYPLGNQAVKQCIASGRRLGIITEAPDPRGILGCGRWAKYTVERYSKGFHYDFVLAMGEMGVTWFRRCGYPARSLFPFAYVTEPARPSDMNESTDGPVLLFAGRFIALKGLDILFRAFAAVPSKNAQLRLLGDGPEKQQLEGLARDLGIQNRVAWLAKRDSAGVRLEMEKSDLILLPSRKDGWGAVVNESLMAGTPVICSTACGAAELVRQPWLGTVFRSGRVDELAKALKHWIVLGPRSQMERERIRSWATCISGQAVAKYFTAIMDHIYSNSARPVAPWRL